MVSPLLANLYLHHVLDLWVRAWQQKVARGDMFAVRYADDAVLGFQHREDAEKFQADYSTVPESEGAVAHTRRITCGPKDGIARE